MSFLFINVNHDVGYESSESIPISTGYILAALKAKGYEGVILDDLRDRPLGLKNLEKWIRRIEPWVVGFTVYQSTINRIRFLSRYIKSRHPQIGIVLGGPQIIAMPPQGLADLRDVDVLVKGEAELVMPVMAGALSEKASLEKVPGIVYKSDTGIVDTGPGPVPAEDLDDYPSPYLSDILNLEGKNTAIMLSSRGCRHVCRFCITPSICKGKIRSHSVERVLDEMEYLSGKGIERFWFADPNFTDDRQRTERLLSEKLKRGIETPFWFQTRTDLVDPSLLEKLKEAGADTVAFGLESGSPAVLEKTNKKIELEQLRRNVRTAQSLGMEAELFSIFGLPHETVEDAKQTIEFVRSLEIPIQSNSGSQQMQLYFGSIYEMNPGSFGIKPLPMYRPAYLSVGEHYETDAMTLADMRKVRNLWALANEQMEMDVYYKQRIFEILDFLLENEDDLKDRPSFYAYGALTSSAIEEFDLLHSFLNGYADVADDGDMPIEQLISALSFFQQTTEPVGPHDRLIFDSRSWINGVPFTGISGKYWDVLLGRGLLLDSFEQGFLNAVEGQTVTFSFNFPHDYFQEELADKEVQVSAKIHKVLKVVRVENLEELKKLEIRNEYDFAELDLLKEQNEILYYLSLKTADPGSLLKTPSHFLMLAHKYAKLGKKDKIQMLTELVREKPTAINAVADTLAGSGKHAWALELYEQQSGDRPSLVLKKVKCLLGMGKTGRAYDLLKTLPESQDLEFVEILLECLKHANPSSKRIPILEHQILDLRLQAALSRDAIGKGGHFAPPIVHGE